MLRGARLGIPIQSGTHGANGGAAVGERNYPDPSLVGMLAHPDIPAFIAGGPIVVFHLGEARHPIGQPGGRFQVQEGGQYPAVAATVEHEAGSHVDGLASFQVIHGDQRMVGCEGHSSHRVPKAQVDALTPDLGGQGLVEVVARNLKGPGVVVRQCLRKREALPLVPRQKHRAVFARVTTGLDGGQQTRLAQELVAAGQERFPDDVARKEQLLDAQHAMSELMKPGAGQATRGASTQDDDVHLGGDLRQDG